MVSHYEIHKESLMKGHKRTMKKATRKLMVEYLAMKARQKELAAEVDEAGDNLLVLMLEEGIDKEESEQGSVSVSTRTTAVNADSIIAHLDKIKRMAEEKGQVTYKPKPVLTARLAKVEEESDG